MVTSPCRLGSTSSAIRTETANTPWTTDFKVLGTIGRGKFAVVKKCLEKSSGQQYAAKCIRKRRHNRDCTPDILHEIAVLEMGISHPHLIKLHKVYETPTEFVLILEYAAGGEIFDHCVGVKDTFSENTSRRLMRQILDAVHFLHDNDIVHLDLKPQNILLSKDGTDPESAIKLVDFGLSKYIADGLEIREILGTPDYVAPEVLNYEPLSTATDIWSLGVVAYVMLTGVSPFLGETKQDTLMNVTTAVLDFPSDLFDSLSPTCRDFIRKMLQRDPIDRCSALQSISHPWITGVISPEIPLENHDENGLEDVFLNGDCICSDDHLPNSNGKTSEENDKNSAGGGTDPSAEGDLKNVAPSISVTKLNDSISQGSDVDFNGNILEENGALQRDSLLSTPTSCQTLSDLSVASDDSNGSSVDLQSRPVRPVSSSGAVVNETPKKNNKLNSSVTKNPSNEDKLKKEALSEVRSDSDVSLPSTSSPKIAKSSSAQTTSRSPSGALHKIGTCVDSSDESGKENKGVANQSPRSHGDVGQGKVAMSTFADGTSVDSGVKNSSNSNVETSKDTPPHSVHSTNPCLKRRKFDYCRSSDQSATEISVAD